MKFSLLPKIIVPALTDVTEEILHSRDIKLLIGSGHRKSPPDFDNRIIHKNSRKDNSMNNYVLVEWTRRESRGGLALR